MKLSLNQGIIPLILLILAAASVSASNQSIKITPIIDKTIYLNNQYTSLFKIEIKGKSPCTPDDQVTVWYNVSKEGLLVKESSFTKAVGCSGTASTGSFTPLEKGDYVLCGMVINSTLREDNSSLYNSVCNSFQAMDTSVVSCDVALQLKTNESIFYENGQSLKFTLELNNESFPYVIEYWIEDLFGNIVKPKINTTNTNEKSWKTNIEEQDRVLFMKAIAHPSCSDDNLSNNAVQKMFVVTKNQMEETPSSSAPKEENSTINVSDINPQTASYGGMVSADLQIYKGGTDKYSISVWVEKDGKTISEKTKANLKTKYSSYKVTLPVRIDPDCDGKLDEGTAQLVVEGLGAQAEKEITVQGTEKDSCPASSAASGSDTTTKAKNSVAIQDFPAQINAWDTARVKVEVIDTEDADYQMWSYLYRGSKCYSCASGEKDDNVVSFSVKEGKPKVVEMLVTADPELEDGEYSLAVKYQKDDQKTIHSLTEKVYLKASSKDETRTINQTMPLLSAAASLPVSTSKKIQAQEQPDYDGIVVYESTSEKSKKIISWTLFVAFGLLSLVLALRKHSD